MKFKSGDIVIAPNGLKVNKHILTMPLRIEYKPTYNTVYEVFPQKAYVFDKYNTYDNTQAFMWGVEDIDSVCELYIPKEIKIRSRLELITD